MEAKQTRIGRLLAAVLAVLALVIGYGALTATVTPAHAADPSYGNIDQGATGSIIIHKGVQQGSSASGTASGTAPSNFQGLAGVTFTAYPITSVHLDTTGGWSTVNSWTTTPLPEIADGTACNGTTPTLTGQTLGSGSASPTTDAQGQATIGTLAVGAYLVCETSSPSSVVDKAQPFIITIPYPDTTGTGATNGWLYNPNVYPKNGVASITKTVSGQTNLGLGATASFPVTTTVPSIASIPRNSSFTHYWVQDVLDSRLTNGNVSSVTVDGAALDPSYYTVIPATSANGNLVQVAFTNAGLTWLKANAGKQIVTTFTGTVSSLGTGAINNTAYLGSGTQISPNPPTTPTTPPTGPNDPNYPTNPSNPNPPAPSTPVTTNWGELKINKVDAGNGTTGLQGAQFKVYDTTTQPTTGACTSTTPTGDPIKVLQAGATTPTDTFTSDGNGQVDIAGLYVSDSTNRPGVTQRCYVIVETQAPAGYVAAGNTAATVTIGAATTVGSGNYPTIKNTKQAIPGLPLTGAQAQMVLIMLGIALLLAAAGIVLVNRRRRAQRSA